MIPATFTQAIQQLQTAARIVRHRQLVVVAGEADWCRQQARQAIDLLQPRQGLWLGRANQTALTVQPMSQASHWLGRETDLLIVDSHLGVDPDAIAAISGTLQAGGLLLWLLPSLTTLSRWPDPELKRLYSQGVAAIEHSPFLARLVRSIRADERLYCIEQGQPFAPLPEGTPATPVPATVAAPCITEDQRDAVEAVLHVVSGHRRRPLVLTADRGRGKSAAFGIAAAQLLLQGKQRIRVVAPAWSCVETLFQHAERLLSGSEPIGQCLCLGAARLEFVAPDALDDAAVDLLLVDEAAALPVSLLEKLLRQYSRIAFATTVHGYEGTGRGFAVRFRETLDAQTPGWRELKMQQPVRWSENDPLEAFIFRAFLLDAEPTAVQPEAVTLDACRFEMLTGDEIAQDEVLLQQVFGLLVQAHYRTRPFDLRLLLDAPDISIYIARHERQVMAVCLAVAEGGLEPAYCEAVFRGERWLKGHLLPQLMQVQLPSPVLTLRGVRILRIAVRPDWQGKGLGTRLIQSVEQDCQRRQLAWLGTSFGADERLLRFWNRQDLLPVSLATRQEARSGEYSLALVKALDTEAQAALAQISRRAGDRFVDGLSSQWRALEPALVVRLMAGWRIRPETLGQQDIEELRAFARGRRRYEDSTLALRRWLLCLLAERQADRLDPDECHLLIEKLLQGRSWHACGVSRGLSGERPLVDRMREIVSKIQP